MVELFIFAMAILAISIVAVIIVAIERNRYAGIDQVFDRYGRYTVDNPPEVGVIYYTDGMHALRDPVQMAWDGTLLEKYWMTKGVVFRTREGCQRYINDKGSKNE